MAEQNKEKEKAPQERISRYGDTSDNNPFASIKTISAQDKNKATKKNEARRAKPEANPHFED